MTGNKSNARTDEADRRANESTPNAETTGAKARETEVGVEAAYEHMPADTALVLDAMLGKLSTYLRMCGYDATYTSGRGFESESDVLALAHTEGRLLVTRDRELARRADRSVSLSSRDVVDQLRELQAAGFALTLADEPVRCSACNGLLERVDRTEPTPDYAADPHEQPVWRCRECGQHFWKGSHWDDVAATLDEL